MNTQRLEKVLKKMETEGLEQMIISDPYAIYYLTGRFIDPGERLLALYINQSGKNKIFINNLFTVPEDLGVEKFRFSDTDDYLTPLCDCVEAGKPLGIDKTFAARFLIPVIDHSALPPTRSAPSASMRSVHARMTKNVKKCVRFPQSMIRRWHSSAV